MLPLRPLKNFPNSRFLQIYRRLRIRAYFKSLVLPPKLAINWYWLINKIDLIKQLVRFTSTLKIIKRFEIFLPTTRSVKVQVASFPSLSTAVYVITFSSAVNLIGGETIGDTVTLGSIPLLSVALGIVQVTTIEFSLFGRDTVLLFGQVLPNEGGWVSAKTNVYIRMCW